MEGDRVPFLNSCTLQQLKEFAKQRSLQTSGSKADLVARLAALNADSWQAIVASANQRVSLSRSGTVPKTVVSSPSVVRRESGDLRNEGTTERRRETTDDTRDCATELTRREMEVLRREKEVLEREVRLLQRLADNTTPAVSVTSAASSTSTIGIRSIADLLPDFSGDRDAFESWKAQLELLRMTYNLDERSTKVLFSQRIKGKVRDWFHSRPAHLQSDMAELLGKMDRMFNRRPDKMRLREDFVKRKWQRNESFADYFHAKATLGNKIPIDDDELIQYAIEGVPNVHLRRHAYLQRFNTPEDLLEGFENVSLDPEPKENSCRREEKKDGAKTSRGEATVSTRRDSARCYNCGETGHRSNTCPRPATREKGACFRCGSMQHQIRDCPKDPTQPKQPKEPKEPEKTPTLGSTTNVVESAAETAPYLVSLSYAVADEVGNVCTYNVVAMIDSGSPISLIKEDFVPLRARKPIVENSNAYYGINGSKLNVSALFPTNCSVGDVPMNLIFHIVPEETMNCAALLGRDFMSSPHISVSFKETAIVSKRDCIPATDGKQNDAPNEILLIDCDVSKATNSQNLNINPQVSHSISEKLTNLFTEEYVNNKCTDPDPKSDVEMVISLKHDQPISFRPRRLAFSDKEKLKVILDQLLRDGIIRPSESAYTSPIVLVRKKNGEVRLCIDYSVGINKITIRDNFPIPLIDDHLDQLRNKHYFSCLDLKNGFHHVRVSESSVKFTSFVTPFGQFEYLRMPFGLTNAPRVFQRFVNSIFSELIRRNRILIYVDDILIATEDVEEHFCILRDVFRLAARHGLDFRLDKCSFLFEETTYLGYLIDKDGIRPGKDTVEAVLNYPIPRNPKEAHRFVCLASYFRRFIKNFSSVAKPLYDLIKKNVKFQFGTEELAAFETLKTCLASRPILAIYSPKLATELHCDASSSGFGAILMQKQPDGLLKPVFYFSKRTTEVESKYHSFELECLAVVYAVQRFHIYLFGIKFKIFTDCDSFRLTLGKSNINPRISRWALFLEAYDYTIEHRPGTKMSHVDALSRCHGVLILESTGFERILSVKQDKDKEIIEIRDRLENEEDRYFELRDGLVYRKTKDRRLLFYVPKCLEDNVIRTCHDDIGHVGIDKVVDNINRVYWFPKLREKVKKYIANCLKCVEFSPTSGKREGYLHSLPKGNIPFQTIHVDHYGPLEKSGRGFKHILSVVDGFTKFIRLYPCKSTTTDETTGHLSDYFRSYSKPKRLVSDRGTCFTSGKFATFIEEWAIEHVLVAVGTPRANGQVERFNRTITPMLSKLVESPNKWCNALICVEYALNNTLCRSTGTTPSELLFGIAQSREPNDQLRELLQSLSTEERDLPSVRNAACTAISEVQEENSRNYNKKRKPSTVYKEGDYVMIKNYDTTPGVNKKLIPKYKGPYVVKCVLDFDRYVVSDIDGFQLTQIPYTGTISADHMKLWDSG